MNLIKKLYILSFLLMLTIPWSLASASEKDNTPLSTKKERNHITKGNKLYEEGKFREAMNQYKYALEENPASVVGKYNLGLSEIRIGSNPNDTSETARKMLESGIKNMEQIANLGSKRADLASKANYNLGNVAFNSEDFQKAVEYYKQSLRLNPEDDNARRNLRIAQLKIQNQDQNQDNQDQQQEQDQQQDKNEDHQEDQNQDQQDQNQEQEQEQQEQNQKQQSSLNQQTAEQILNAIENKENQTRARVAGQNAEKSRNKNRNKKNW